MSAFEILSIVLMILAIVVTLLGIIITLLLEISQSDIRNPLRYLLITE